MTPSTEEVFVYGGSFDPPHTSHVMALCAARALTGVRELLVVPSFKHPFGKKLAPYESRLQLCEIAFSWIPGVRISRIESELAGDLRTLDVLQALARQRPGIRMRLLVGSDILNEAHKWHRWDLVSELAPPFVLGRAGHPYPGAPEAFLPQIASRELRAALAEGRDLPPGALPAGVIEAIRALGLYAGLARP